MSNEMDSFTSYIAAIKEHDHAVCMVESDDAAAFVFLFKPTCEQCGAAMESKSGDGFVTLSLDVPIDNDGQEPDEVTVFAIGRSEASAKDSVDDALAEYRKLLPAFTLLVWVYGSLQSLGCGLISLKGRGLKMGGGFAAIAPPAELPTIEYKNPSVSACVITREVKVLKHPLRVISGGLTASDARLAHENVIRHARKEMKKMFEGQSNV